jgi:predicted dehydrogenase
MLAAPALAADRAIEVALLTHAGGPHLGAYVEGLAKCAEVSKVHLAGADALAEVQKGLGAKLGSVNKSPKELFAGQKPPLAIVTMEAAVAPPVIDAALEAGCHVMAEKPACVRVADFEPLAAKAKSRDRQLMLALANRVDPVMREARRIVQSGEVGRVYGVELQTIADQTRLTRPAYHGTWYAKKPRGGGGHLIWLGIHWLDLAMYIAGSRIAEVAGFTANVGGQPIDVEDSAAISFRFDNGTLGNITSAYFLDKGKQLVVKVWGSQGWVEVNHGTDRPLIWYSTRDGAGKTSSYVPPSGVATGYTAWVHHVVRSAAGIEEPVLSPDESLYVLRTIFASYKASETGRTQRVAG